ncbi:hypothetical protein KUTeg_021392 [Tegillarca granosa]|uniref:Adenylate kinase n=1 Tax=Tegillarca granosa TaxID=220873 RepID=A0ABQ9E339_TEGGR|nr:hypothetical protein KUTeg_021392 [Tegillarca granosa]
MDQTKRPLLIPPEFGTYAEKHGIFDMYKRLMEQLIINRPDDPLAFLIDLLKRENDDVAQILILGPPASGKKTMSKLEIPTDLWTQMIQERLKLFDCVKKGWVMEGFPQTREQALALQSLGIYPKHCVVLEAPDTVLIERAQGKRVDPKTGDIYHTTFDWPPNIDIQNRCEEVPGYTEEDMVNKLIEYHLYTYLCRTPRSNAPHTPRVVLIGSTGSGKGVQASLLASKYNIVNVSCGSLIKQALSGESKPGQAAKAYIEKGLMERLAQLDCVSRGWVLHGYPQTREQAEGLSKEGFVPNRLTLRATDPITGERYHMLYNPPRTQEVKSRLQKHAKDEEETVKKRLASYNAYVEELTDYYLDGQHVNGDQDPHTVFECIESMIVNPLPKRFSTFKIKI